MFWRPLHSIAQEISRVWENPDGKSASFVKALCYLQTAQDKVGDADGKTVIRNFIAASRTWSNPAKQSLIEELRAHTKDDGVDCEIATDEIREKPCPQCEFCGALFENDGGFVIGGHICGREGAMCLTCHLLAGTADTPQQDVFCRQNTDGSWYRITWDEFNRD